MTTNNGAGAMDMDADECQPTGSVTATTTTDTTSIFGSALMDMTSTPTSGITPIPQSKGQDATAVAQMSFEQLRADAAGRWVDADDAFAQQLMSAKDIDELWAITNMRDHRAAREEEFDASLKMREMLMETGIVQKARESAAKQYMITDPKTGQEVKVDPNNPDHLDELAKKMTIMVHKSFTPEDNEKFTRAANYDFSAVELGDDRVKEADITMTKTQYEDFQKTGRVPVGMKGEFESMQNDNVELVKYASSQRFNSISEAPATNHIYEPLRARDVPFSLHATKFFPLRTGVLTSAAMKFGREIRTSLIFANLFPTVMFESKLRMLMFGQRGCRVITSFSYHESIHSLYMHVLGTDILPNHDEFLEKEQKMCEETYKQVREEEEKLLKSGSIEDNEVLRLRVEDCRETAKAMQLYQGGIVQATRALREGNIVTPFAPFFTLEKGGWTQADIPRRSKQEVVQIFEVLRDQEGERYSRELKCIEDRFRSGQIGEEQFLNEFWLFNYISTINNVNYFEAGLLHLFQDAIPGAYRADCVSRADVMVPSNDHVLNAVRNELERERTFYRELRSHCRQFAVEQAEQDGVQVTFNGVALDRTKFDVSKRIENTAMPPTLGELADFYEVVTTDYGNVAYMAKAIDAMDEALSEIYTDKGLIGDYEKTLNMIKLRWCGSGSGGKKKKKRGGRRR